MNKEWASFRAARARGDEAAAWSHLERAHILSQVYPLSHTGVHLEMLGYAWRTRAWAEFAGQIPRFLLAGIGSSLGRAPLGNPGTIRVGIQTPAEVPEDLKTYVEKRDG